MPWIERANATHGAIGRAETPFQVSYVPQERT